MSNKPRVCSEEVWTSCRHNGQEENLFLGANNTHEAFPGGNRGTSEPFMFVVDVGKDVALMTSPI